MFKDALKRVLRQPFPNWLVAASLGAALATLCIDSRLILHFLSSKDAANWASAAGSLAAALVALSLGISATTRERKAEIQRYKQVASVFHGAGARSLPHLKAMVRTLKMKPTKSRLERIGVLAAERRWWHDQAPSSLIHELPPALAIKANHAQHVGQIYQEKLLERIKTVEDDEDLKEIWVLLRKDVNRYSEFLLKCCSGIWDLLGREKRWQNPDQLQNFVIGDVSLHKPQP